MSSINDRPTEKTYNARLIGWELERTAMGDGYFGNALRVAMDIPGIDDADKAVLQRYATGCQHGEDHVCLQNIAKKVYFSETVPKCKTMTKKEVLDRIHLLSDEVYANEKENWAMQEEIDALYAKINSGEFVQKDSFLSSKGAENEFSNQKDTYQKP